MYYIYLNMIHSYVSYCDSLSMDFIKTSKIIDTKYIFFDEKLIKKKFKILPM